MVALETLVAKYFLAIQLTGGWLFAKVWFVLTFRCIGVIMLLGDDVRRKTGLATMAAFTNE
jgi:hypothetical protein